MLLRFSVSNFTSIRDFQELSLIAGSLSGPSDALIEPSGLQHKVLRVAAIYGPNASGKSNALWALRFMRAAVKNSQKSWNPDAGINRHPFALDDSIERPSEFAIDMLIGGVRYEYGFAVDSERVLAEHLYAYPENRRQLWFERNIDKPRMAFGKNLTGENRTIENLTRANSLFVSAAAQNNHEKLLPIFKWFANELSFHSGMDNEPIPRQTIEMCLGNEQTKSTVLRLLSGADLGIVGMEIKEQKPDEKMSSFAEKFRQLMAEYVPDQNEIPTLRNMQTISLQHNAQGKIPVAIPFSDESDGTLAFIAILGPTIKRLATGGVLCIDELDASLHPLLVADIVSMFNGPETNPSGAQLLFTTHNTELLGMDVLRRDQVWFTEKDNAGATRIYPLSDFKPRKHENLQRGYLQGRYGATPFIRASALLAEEE